MAKPSSLRCRGRSREGAKGAGGDDHGPGRDLFLQGGDYSVHLAVFHQEPVGHGLADPEIGLVLHHLFHAQPVEEPVGLGPGRPDRRTLAGVEAAELDAGGVYVSGHLSAQGIDFLDQVALGQTADGRVAAHGSDGIGVAKENSGAAAHAGRGQGRFAAGMAGADDDDVVLQFFFHVHER